MVESRDFTWEICISNKDEICKLIGGFNEKYQSLKAAGYAADGISSTVGMQN